MDFCDLDFPLYIDTCCLPHNGIYPITGWSITPGSYLENEPDFIFQSKGKAYYRSLHHENTYLYAKYWIPNSNEPCQQQYTCFVHCSKLNLKVMLKIMHCKQVNNEKKGTFTVFEFNKHLWLCTCSCHAWELFICGPQICVVFFPILHQSHIFLPASASIFKMCSLCTPSQSGLQISPSPSKWSTHFSLERDLKGIHQGEAQCTIFQYSNNHPTQLPEVFETTFHCSITVSDFIQFTL